MSTVPLLDPTTPSATGTASSGGDGQGGARQGRSSAERSGADGGGAEEGRKEEEQEGGKRKGRVHEVVRLEATVRGQGIDFVRNDPDGGRMRLDAGVVVEDREGEVSCPFALLLR